MENLGFLLEEYYISQDEVPGDRYRHFVVAQN